MYTAAFADHGAAVTFSALFGAALAKDGRFTVRTVETKAEKLGPISVKKRMPRVFVFLHTIRRVKSGDYCGQHPGPCAGVPRAKRHGSWLEWDDWVVFHSIVNDVIDEMGVFAEVWTDPSEAKGAHMPGTGRLFMIRKAGKRRQKFDWEDDPTYFGIIPRRLWNMGSDDQFTAEVT